jgi:hypothetical protein
MKVRWGQCHQQPLALLVASFQVHNGSNEMDPWEEVSSPVNTGTRTEKTMGEEPEQTLT